jgi:hypothetical protein
MNDETTNQEGGLVDAIFEAHGFPETMGLAFSSSRVLRLLLEKLVANGVLSEADLNDIVEKARKNHAIFSEDLMNAANNNSQREGLTRVVEAGSSYLKKLSLDT